MKMRAKFEAFPEMQHELEGEGKGKGIQKRRGLALNLIIYTLIDFDLHVKPIPLNFNVSR